MMDINFIREAIEPDIEKLGCKVWGLELFGRHSNQTLRVYIDNEKGISLEDCEVVSKHISKVLDVENNFSEKYSLEVSSPGLDRKFFHNITFVWIANIVIICNDFFIFKIREKIILNNCLLFNIP